MRQHISPHRLLDARSSLETAGLSVGREGRKTQRCDRWEADLSQLLRNPRTPLHLVGVGNSLKGDDSVGLRIISGLVAKMGRRPRRNVFLHSPTTTLERLLSRIDCRKERVLIFDSVAAGGEPGQVTLANLGDSKFGYFATHNVPIRLLPGVAANPSNAYVAGIEPENLGIGEELSDTVRASAESVTRVVESVLGGGANGRS